MNITLMRWAGKQGTGLENILWSLCSTLQNLHYYNNKLLTLKELDTMI